MNEDDCASILIKVEKVVNSCNTLKQLEHAKKYASVAILFMATNYLNKENFPGKYSILSVNCIMDIRNKFDTILILREFAIKHECEVCGFTMEKK